MKNSSIINITIVSIALILIAMQFFLAEIVSKFEGTDDQAVGIINELAPNYKPWAASIWEPSGDWGETLLFTFQTFLGLSILVFYFIKKNTKKKTDKC
ncbi:cobalt ABC transporter substrate-binding protein CbiN [Lutibacter sp. HS1-25]|uniref:energy-coupling factor ABC transporter substrate-binding protein n=1 Tax=Lutibacter sp. HS1-25 TaxID=2485000 RepID=UPI0010107A14|nr:energy-coupling factor ABC transporter substrate-binding protein [Lutibacter sp. HS1-25]RXP61355.1 cobalt ABC transporter substrate-binding protein CbiN [Lutibacter sp. HS1-25]